MKKFLLLLLIICSSLKADLPKIRPQALEKGDLIALVFPASFLDKDFAEAQMILKRKAEWLSSRGYRTVFYPSKVNVYGYLAGTDNERASALMQAWKNPDVKAIWCFRGGYGTPRILDLLDYEWIKAHPKIFIGMSDITALHIAIQKQTGLVTFLAPVLNMFDEKDSLIDENYALSAFEQIVVHHKKGVIPLPQSHNLKVVKAGTAKGILVGGNLCLIAALCGTKWQLDTNNKIVVLEDVKEEIYCIDRLLWQLKEAGLLKNPAAVILGTWQNCKNSSKNGLTLEEVFAYYFSDAKYPVIMGFPSGHDRYQTTIPLNAEAEVDTAAMTIRLLEKSVR